VSLHKAACAASARVSNAVAHPLAFPAFCALLIALWAAAGIEVANFAISIITAGLLFLMATAQKRRDDKLEAEIDALAEANPDVDEAAVREAVE
jgi:Flp pilus assembly protein TadB